MSCTTNSWWRFVGILQGWVYMYRGGYKMVLCGYFLDYTPMIPTNRFGPWIRKIMINCCLDQLSRKSVMANLDDIMPETQRFMIRNLEYRRRVDTVEIVWVGCRACVFVASLTSNASRMAGQLEWCVEVTGGAGVFEMACVKRGCSAWWVKAVETEFAGCADGKETGAGGVGEWPSRSGCQAKASMGFLWLFISWWPSSWYWGPWQSCRFITQDRPILPVDSASIWTW